MNLGLKQPQCPKISLKRTLRAIQAERRAIERSIERLCKLRSDLEYVEAMCDGARRDLQEAINALCQVERL